MVDIEKAKALLNSLPPAIRAHQMAAFVIASVGTGTVKNSNLLPMEEAMEISRTLDEFDAMLEMMTSDEIADIFVECTGDFLEVSLDQIKQHSGVDQGTVLVPVEHENIIITLM